METSAKNGENTAADMELLSRIQSPADLRGLSADQLEPLCADIRRTLLETVSQTGGHLASNLGVVELTVALHRVFDTPRDKILWDVGHQCYVHKLLTGRKERFGRLRKSGGLSGFPRPAESVYDAFVAGHSSTSISAACGMAAAKGLSGDDGYVVAVIGDGALTGGLAYEGLSNVGRVKDRLIVVLNDNRMSISKNVGFIARHLTTLRTRTKYVRFKSGLAAFVGRIPLVGGWLYRRLFRLKTDLKNVLYESSSMFEDLGLYYLGPVDGHSLPDLTKAMKAAKTIGRPVLLHVVTQKGKGCAFAAQHPERYHGVSAFDRETGEPLVSGQGEATFSQMFGGCMQRLAKEEPRLCAVTAAMPSGTGLQGFAAQYPDRFFDVGIAEEHAVTFCSGLSCGGFIPVFAVYSTFLQRAYDQLLNDTAIAGNHVVLAIDRAGIVPEDGETHQGLFDVPFLRSIPGTTLYAPATYSELETCLRRAVREEKGLVAVRYPKGSQPALLADYPAADEPFTFLPRAGARALLVTYGRLFAAALEAAKRLESLGYRLALLKLNRIWPVDPAAVERAAPFERVFFFEEGSVNGGIGEWFAAKRAERGGRTALRGVEGFGGVYTTDEGLAQAGLDVEGMVRTVMDDDG